MKIIEVTDVEFSGTGTINNVEVFWLQDDTGNRQSVGIPKHERLIEQFHWLSDNDCLRHLRALSPTLETNAEAIEEAQRYNANHDEHAWLVRKYDTTDSRGYTSSHPLGYNRMKVPAPTWKATWSFWSKEHAIMFKLAMGGNV